MIFARVSMTSGFEAFVVPKTWMLNAPILTDPVVPDAGVSMVVVGVEVGVAPVVWGAVVGPVALWVVSVSDEVQPAVKTRIIVTMTIPAMIFMPSTLITGD